jgi:hypothetical protein
MTGVATRQGEVSSVLFDTLLQCDYSDLSNNAGIDQSLVEGFLACHYTRLREMQILEGSDCGLRGPLHALQKLTALSHLDLSFNSLSGHCTP